MRIRDWSSDVCSSDLAADVVGRDLADEARDIDAGRAGLDAGRVVAEVAAAGLDQRGLAVERRVNVAEVLGVGGVRQTPGTDVRLVSHRDLPDRAGGRCSFAAACVPVANDWSHGLTERSINFDQTVRFLFLEIGLNGRVLDRDKG